jgi:hypothetical protein
MGDTTGGDTYNHKKKLVALLHAKGFLTKLPFYDHVDSEYGLKNVNARPYCSNSLSSRNASSRSGF